MALGSFATRVVATKVVATDGTGDFTDIQSAIDDLPAAGGVVFIKEGTYTLTAGITITADNITLEGTGRGTQISTAANITMLLAQKTAGAAVITGISIRSLYFINTSGAATDGVAIRIDAPVECRVVDCWVYDQLNKGIEIFKTSETGGNNIVHGNFINGCKIGIYIDDIKRSTVSENNVTLCSQYGIQIDASHDSVIDSNICFQNGYHGIYVSGSDNNIIMGNVCEENDVDNTASYDGIALSNSDNCVVNSNRCLNNDRYEINIINNTCNKTLVVGNNLQGDDHVGTLNDDGTDTTAANNNS